MLENGVHTITKSVDGDRYIANVEVTYTCDGDLELTAAVPNITCDYDGAWIGEVGVCGK